MTFRFRKTVRLLPGVRLNLSKGAPSVSLGTAGLTVNLSARGAKATVGVPGTGLSCSSSASGARPPVAAPPPQLHQPVGAEGGFGRGFLWGVAAVLVVLAICLIAIRG